MDPNETLRLLVNPGTDSHTWVEAFDSLYQWVERGGFLAHRLNASGHDWSIGWGGMATLVHGDGSVVLSCCARKDVKVTA
jgi:hypothetical protein